MRSRGIEPPRAKPTATSTLRVYHFRHDRKEFRSVELPAYGYRLTLLQARSGCLSKPDYGVQGEACHAGFWPSQPGLMAALSAKTRVLPAAQPRRVEWLRSRRLVPYEEAVAVMDERVAAIARGEAPDCVWLLEHPPIYTAGTSAAPAELLAPTRLPVFVSGRGGRFTYHGPGQRVIYVMFDLASRGRDVRAFVAFLEDWLIATLARLGVEGGRHPGQIGVFVQGQRSRVSGCACAVGSRCTGRASTWHPSLSISPASCLAVTLTRQRRASPHSARRPTWTRWMTRSVPPSRRHATLRSAPLRPDHPEAWRHRAAFLHDRHRGDLRILRAVGAAPQHLGDDPGRA